MSPNSPAVAAAAAKDDVATSSAFHWNMKGDANTLVVEHPESIDGLLSQELLQLSLEDRNTIYEELHGVHNSNTKTDDNNNAASAGIQETPEFLESKLLELAEELVKIPDDKPWKNSYIESQILLWSYVNTSDFRLRFLRCELFDCKKAAIRLCKFLDYAEDLFGPVVLERPLKLSDLDKEDTKLLKIGNTQILPFRDRAGRIIWAWVGDFGFQDGTIRNRHKMCLYQYWTMSEDLTTQTDGFVFLAWAGSSQAKHWTTVEWGDVKFNQRFVEGIPLRMSAVQYCLPDTPFFHVFRAGMGLAMGRDLLCRTRFHIGAEVDLRYTLQTYGIPVDTLPVTGSGTIKTNYLKQWIAARERLEDDRDNHNGLSEVVVIPRAHDVVFRTGKMLLAHPGNAKLQVLMESRMSEYSKATKMRKETITKQVLAVIRQRGGRFLVWNNKDGWWTELHDEDTIHIKVSSSLKSARKRWEASRTPPQALQSSTRSFSNQDHAKRRKVSDLTSVTTNTDTADGNASERNCDCACLF